MGVPFLLRGRFEAGQHLRCRRLRAIDKEAAGRTAFEVHIVLGFAAYLPKESNVDVNVRFVNALE